MEALQELLSAPLPNLPVLSIALFLSIFFLYSVRKKRRNIKLPPSPPRLPFIGNLHQIGSQRTESFHELSQKYGPLMLLHFGHAPWLIISSTEMASAIMRTHDANFATRPSSIVSDILRFNDIAFAPAGDDWRELKKIFTVYLMSTKKVHSYKTIIEEENATMLKRISDHVASSRDKPLDLSDIMFTYMLDVVARVVCGKFFMEEGRYHLFREIIEENFYLLGRFSFGDLYPSLGWLENINIGLKNRTKRVIKKWGKLFDEMVEDKIAKGKSPEGHENFMDILLELKNDPNIGSHIAKEFINGLLIDAFSAGVDTTYVVMDWVVAELVRHPHVMKKLKDEVRGLAKDSDMVRTEHVNQMVYMRAMMKEILRLHAPAPLLLPREAIEDCEINGYTIPKGTKLFTNVWAIQTDPKNWDAPMEFKPERFLGSQVDFKGNHFNFIPFGAGRRLCPGYQFAMATAELALANIVHKYDWELPSGMTIDQLSMEEVRGIPGRRTEHLKLVPRPISASD